jgi:hypothetical protein
VKSRKLTSIDNPPPFQPKNSLIGSKDKGIRRNQIVIRFPCSLVSVKEGIMLAKVTVKNQLTLPKAVVARFSGVEYFDVSTDGACITLRPLQRSRAEEVRNQLAQLGIEEQDVAAAVRWARETPRP